MHHLIDNIVFFLKMDGYGAFIWSAYGLMLVLFLVSLVSSFKKFHRIKARLRSEN
ncbi:MAG: heme exporter protein CcmD [Gammaproteobacteria bacterium]|nr:heme exporter protein CcmD [Gammaproteobacteria bacterium]